MLLRGFFYYSDDGDGTDDLDLVVSRNYCTQCLSALLSPLGTYYRWYLSRLNGSIRHEHWEWLPIETFLANMIASVVSAFVSALLVLDGKNNYHQLAVVVAKAIQMGYAGSFSTVSTYVTETVGLMRALLRAFWGYYYGFGSLLCAFVLGVASYGWSVA